MSNAKIILVLGIIFLVMAIFTQRDRFKRLSQRDMLPQAIQSRNLGEIIKLGSTDQASVSLDAGAQVLFQVETESLLSRLLFTTTEISLYEGSVSAANQIGVGSAVDESKYQIYISKDLEDARNIIGTTTNIYVRNIDTTDLSKRVSAQDNDGYNQSGSWNTTDVVFSFGSGSSGSITSAFRFINVAIPQGATINSATLTINPDASDTSDVNTKIYGIDEDNTADFSSDPTGRTKTTASVDWDFTSTTIDVVEVSPDITAIIQEIVNRASWSNGNAMGFLIVDDSTPDNSPDDDFNTFDSYDGESSKAPLLDINYGGGSTKTVILRVRERYLINQI